MNFIACFVKTRFLGKTAKIFRRAFCRAYWPVNI